MREPSTCKLITIGLDLAKNVFRLDGVLRSAGAVPDRHGGLRHGAPLGTGADEARPRGAADAGEDVKAYVKRNKNDAADAEAICEAVRRPTIRFVRIKSTEQQGRLM